MAGTVNAYTTNAFLTQDGQADDFIPVTFDLGGSQVKNDRFLAGQNFLNGPLDVVPPRGKIQARGGNSWVLNSDGTATLWTAASGSDRVGLTGERVEFQDAGLTGVVSHAKLEQSNSGANTAVLRLDGTVLNGAGTRAFLRLTTYTSLTDLVELRTGDGVASDNTKVQCIANDLNLDGKTNVYIRNYNGGAASARVDLTASEVLIEAPSGTQIAQVTKVRVRGTWSDPTASSTNHPFDIGPSGTSSGDLRLKLGPSAIKAVDGTATSALKLNPSGGAILGRDYQVVPLRNIGSAISGSPPAANSTTAEYYMQSGTTDVSFTAGVGTLTFPTAFGTGLLSVVAMGKSDAEFNISRGSGTSNNSSVQLIGFLSGAAYTGSAGVDWIAIGW